MSLYEIILAAHILGALFSLVIAVGSVSVLLRGHRERYARCFVAISIVLALEITSGALLALLSPDVTARALCAGLVGYALCGGALLFALRAPRDVTAPPLFGLTGSVAIFIGMILIGV